MGIFSKNIARRPTPVPTSKIFYDPSKPCWKQQQLKVDQIQQITKGNGAILTFIDDGVGINEELLKTVLVEGTRWKAEPKIVEPLLSFVQGIEPSFHGEHSTHGATIVAGNTLGIFPEMKIGSIQVLDAETGVGSMDWVTNGINEATKLNLGVINLSLGSDGPDLSSKKALIRYCSNGKRIAVVAAGNDAKATDYPAAYAKDIDGVLSVAATQIDKEGNVTIAAFSSYGVVNISAPGHSLKSMTQDNQIDYVSGTSFAAPIVSSTIAVAQALNPNITFQQIMYYLTTTAKKIPEANTEHQGAGSIDILSFLKMVKEDAPWKPLKKIKKRSFWDFLGF